MVDPNIVLKGAPAPPAAPALLTPVQAQGQVQKLRALAEANQFRQQQVQGAELHNEAAQRQIAARQAFANAMRTMLAPNTPQAAATKAGAAPSPSANTAAPSPSAVKDPLGNPLPSAPPYTAPAPAASQPGGASQAPSVSGMPGKTQTASGAAPGPERLPFRFNIQGIGDNLIRAGFGDQVPSVAKSLAGIEKDMSDARNSAATAKVAQLDAFGSLAAGVRAHGYTPESAIVAITAAAANGFVSHADALHEIARIQANPNPAFVKQLIDPIIAQSPKQRQLDAQGRTAAAKKETADTGRTKEIVQLPGQQATSAQQVRANLSARAVNAFQGAGPAGYAKFVGGLTPEQQALMNFPQYQAGTKPADFAKQLSGIGLTSQQQIQNAQTEARNKATEAYQQAEIAARNTANRIAAQRLSGGDIQLSPADEAVAQKLASGDLDPVRLSRMKNKQALMARAIQINPNWSSQLYLTKRDFLDPKGKESTNLTTIARIVGHISRFEKNSAALGFAPLYGMAGATIGGTESALDADSHAIAGELEKLVSGGVGSQTEIDAWKHDLRSSFPSVRQKAVDEISHLIGSQYEGMAQQYRAGTHEQLPVARFLTPQAQQWMRSKGIEVATSPVAPQAPAPGPAAKPAPSPDAGLQHKSTQELFDMLAGKK